MIVSERAEESRIEKTFRAERRRLLEFIRSRVRFAEDAEDILQDVFYQMIASNGSIEPIEKMTSWLFTVTRNRIIDWYRKRRPESMTSIQGDDEDERMMDTLFDPASIPDDLYYRSLVWEELSAALDRLPPAQRDVFVMHELEGKSFRDISGETGVSVPTLLSRKRYAVASLRTQLRELYNEFNL